MYFTSCFVQSEHANMVPGLELMYVAVSGGNHFVGGTGRGCQFLRDCGTYVPYSFLGYLSGGQDSVGEKTNGKGRASFNIIMQQHLRQVEHKLEVIKILSEYLLKNSLISSTVGCTIIIPRT